MNTHRRAFTLVELLVVIAIIVVLLALLTPALDKAIYQAELAVCAANKNMIAKGAIVYAADSRRFYPFREGVRDDTTWSPSMIYNGSTALNAFWSINGTTNTTVYDDRKVLSTFISLESLNDPLTGKIDLENLDTDCTAYSTATLWFGYGFKGFKGMKKMGDKMTYSYDGTPKYTWRFDVLVSDRDCIAASGARVSHPDDRGLTAEKVLQNQEVSPGWKQTFSAWSSELVGRGRVDLNFVMQDGSAQRLNGVGIWEEDTAFVPDTVQGTGPLGVWWNTLPVQR